MPAVRAAVYDCFVLLSSASWLLMLTRAVWISLYLALAFEHSAIVS